MISLKNISKKMGDFKLENFNLDIFKNEYFVLLGPTGAGKTVILEIISGMYKPDLGEVWLNNKNVTKAVPEARHIGFVYQDYMLFSNLDVKGNIIFPLTIKKEAVDTINGKLQRMTELLNISGLLKRHTSTLSGGEQQRVALARALINEPEVLLLDEPLSALDPRSKEMFQQELKGIHQKTKTTVIHITHDFNEAFLLADRIGIMQSGKLIEVGASEELFKRPKSSFVAEFLGMENIYHGIISEKENGGIVNIGSIEISGVTSLKGKVNVAIRPEDIIISKETFHSSARNALQGKIISMVPQGLMVKLKLDVGIPLSVVLTEKSREDLNIKAGDQVTAIFKSTAVHIF